MAAAAKQLTCLPLDGVTQHGAMRQFFGDDQTEPGTGPYTTILITHHRASTIVQYEKRTAHDATSRKNRRVFGCCQQTTMAAETPGETLRIPGGYGGIGAVLQSVLQLTPRR